MGLIGSLFGSNHESASNATTSNNISNTSSNVDSHNTAINTTTNSSSNSTVNDTNTVTQDRREVVDHGIGVSADNSSVFTQNSGNSSTSSTDTTNYVTNVSDQGAIKAGLEVSLAGIASNQALALKTVDAGKMFAGTGMDMLKANIAFAQHVSDTAAAETRDSIAQVVASSRDALNQVTTIAAKPLNAQDPQHVLVIVGLVVVGAVLFSKMK